MSEHIVVSVQDHVAEILINRPDKLNAVTPEMNRALAEACRRLDHDEAVRVVLLRGAGERAFCAGSDLDALATYPTPWDFRNRVEHATVIRNLRKPVVAALKGWVLGGGLEIALAADIRVAGKGARFGAPEVTRGWIPGGGATQLLPRLIGYGAAMRLLLTGDRIDANEAFGLGLVEILVEDREVEDKARAVCRTIAGHSPLATQAAKAAARASLSMPLEAGIGYENDLTSLCFASGNYQDGIQAFVGRRPRGST